MVICYPCGCKVLKQERAGRQPLFWIDGQPTGLSSRENLTDLQMSKTVIGLNCPHKSYNVLQRVSPAMRAK